MILMERNLTGGGGRSPGATTGGNRFSLLFEALAGGEASVGQLASLPAAHRNCKLNGCHLSWTI